MMGLEDDFPLQPSNRLVFSCWFFLHHKKIGSQTAPGKPAPGRPAARHQSPPGEDHWLGWADPCGAGAQRFAFCHGEDGMDVYASIFICIYTYQNVFCLVSMGFFVLWFHEQAMLAIWIGTFHVGPCGAKRSWNPQVFSAGSFAKASLSFWFRTGCLIKDTSIYICIHTVSFLSS